MKQFILKLLAFFALFFFSFLEHCAINYRSEYPSQTVQKSKSFVEKPPSCPWHQIQVNNCKICCELNGITFKRAATTDFLEIHDPLKENQDFSNNYTKSRNKSHIVQKNSTTLFVEKLDKKIPTPDPLFAKHVVNGDITDDRAIYLSESRGEDFAKEFRRNTVFENPYHFDLCLIQDLSKLGAKTNQVYVASNSVLTYQCRYVHSLKKWKVKNLGEKYPILEKNHQNGKFHFLCKSMKYDKIIQTD